MFQWLQLDSNLESLSSQMNTQPYGQTVSLAQPHPDYEYDKIPRCLLRKISHFVPWSPHDSDVSFCQKDWEELAKATNGTASVLQFIPATFPSTSVTTSMISWPPTVWDIVSNLNLHAKKSFYEQLSKHKDNKIIKDIYLLRSKQSTSTTWFSFHEGVITASVVHAVLPKLNSKSPLHKNKTSINLCANLTGYQKKPKKIKSLEWGTSKEKIARKRYVRKNKSSHINFQCQDPELFVSQAYPYLGARPDGVISCNCCGEGMLEIKCPWSSRERLISEYITQPESCLTYDELLSNLLSLILLIASNFPCYLYFAFCLYVWSKSNVYLIHLTIRNVISGM